MVALAELNAKRDNLQGRIEALRQRTATVTAKPVEQVRDILEALAKKPEAEQHDLRLKLRGLVADILERVELKPYKANGGRAVEAVITMKLKGDTDNTIASDNIGNYCLQPIDTGETTPEQLMDAIHALETLPK